MSTGRTFTPIAYVVDRGGGWPHGMMSRGAWCGKGRDKTQKPKFGVSQWSSLLWAEVAVLVTLPGGACWAASCALFPPTALPNDLAALHSALIALPGDLKALPCDLTALPSDQTGLPGDQTALPVDLTAPPS